jgi:hypothetical protein
MAKHRFSKATVQNNGWELGRTVGTSEQLISYVKSGSWFAICYRCQ